jgi:hypothetical protein
LLQVIGQIEEGKAAAIERDEAKQRLADMTADYHRWHDAYLRLKYPDAGERVVSNPPPCKTCDGTGFHVDAEGKHG